jgi:hypothetical protein
MAREYELDDLLRIFKDPADGWAIDYFGECNFF